MGHIHLHVGDIDRAAAFYHVGLGFEKMVWSYPGALFMSAGGYHHHLAVNTWSSGAPAAADQARLLSWDLILPEIDTIGDRTGGLNMETPKGLIKALVDRALQHPELQLRARRYA